jgi:large subunit ribosomal protein L10
VNRKQKETVVENFEKLFGESGAAFLVNYKGLDVNEMQLLRGELRQDDALLKITKARLMKIAVQNKLSDVDSVGDFQSFLKEQVGVVFSPSNRVPSIAKKLVKFSKDSEKLQIISGIFEKKILSRSDIGFLATIPPREVLIAMLIRTMQAPLVSFITLLKQLIIRFLYVLKEIEKQKKNG